MRRPFFPLFYFIAFLFFNIMGFQYKGPSSVEIRTDRNEYAPGDTITVSFTNNSSEPIFLMNTGCSAFDGPLPEYVLLKKVGISWEVIGPDLICPQIFVPPTKIEAGDTYSISFSVGIMYPGIYRYRFNLSYSENDPTDSLPEEDLYSNSFEIISTDIAQFAGGEGTEEEPYQIETVEQLQAIADTLYLGEHFIQTADIDASDTENWDDGKGFEPIGKRLKPTADPRFTGVFDGNGHEILNLTISRSDENSVGLFGWASGSGLVKNVSLINVDVTGKVGVGGLAGNARLITNSLVTGKVSGETLVGGLVGSSGNIDSSFADVKVNGNNSIGGLAGQNHGSITRSSATGLVKADSIYAGGLVGLNGGRILESYATVDVSGTYVVGGLCGLNIDDGVPDRHRVGVSHSFATGKVTGKELIGGLVGHNYIVVSTSYWDTETSGQLEGIGTGTGLTTEQMTGQDAYIHMNELDFDEVWQLTEGYPALAWQEPENAVETPEVAILRTERTRYGFGEVATGDSDTVRVAIANAGNMELEIGISLGGENPESFTVDGKELSVALGDTQGVEVFFRPETVDTMSALLILEHNAPNKDNPFEIKLSGWGETETSIPYREDLPQKIKLYQNYPNPFNPATNIGFALPEDAHVSIRIYDIKGRLVSTVADRRYTAGSHTVTWSASQVGSGVYIVAMQSGDVQLHRSITLIN